MSKTNHRIFKMSKETSKLTLLTYAIPVLIALVIILDFTLPGKMYTEKVVKIKYERQQYYNAGGNYHYSYEVVTPSHQFSVAEAFAKEAKGKLIKYSVSLIFKEVNRYSAADSSINNVHSFRIASGLIFPLIVILILFLCYKYKKNWGTLLFVLQVILLADLFLLMN